MIIPQNAPHPKATHIPFGQRDQDQLGREMLASAKAEGKVGKVPPDKPQGGRR